MFDTGWADTFRITLTLKNVITTFLNVLPMEQDDKRNLHKETGVT